MAIEVGTPLLLDTGPAIAALDRLGKADNDFRGEVLQTQKAAQAAFGQSATLLGDIVTDTRAAAAAQRQFAGDIAGLVKEIRDQAAAQREAQRAAAAAAAERRKANAEAREAAKAEKQAAKEAAAAQKEAARAAKEAADASAKAAQEAGKGTSFFGGLMEKASTAFAGLFAVQKVVEVGEEIRRVTAEFEKYEITLTGAFNGDQARAQRALVQVSAFANANGLEVTSLTDTYVKLVNRGIIPTTQQLRQLSDIAATSGKSTDQFVEALLDAQTGEFERLKEFGIKVKNNGDTIAFSFRGVKTEVKNTQEAISQYLFELGDAQGVQGQAAAQLKSLGGAAADSKNAFTELFQVIGERSKSIFGTLSNVTAGAARSLANYFKSTDRIALEQSADGIDKYATFVAGKFGEIAKATKAQGGDVAAALKQAADDQLKFLAPALEQAKKALADYYKSAQEASAMGGGEVDAIDPAQIARYQTVIKSLEGRIDATNRAAKAAVNGADAEADAIGRIAALRAKIAAEEKARDAAPDTNAGNKERVRLVKVLVADNKLLAELLGKQAAIAADKLGPALAALATARADLQTKAANAVIKDSEDQAARAKLGLDEALRQVGLVEQKLKDAEARVKKAGGRGVNADGVIDGAQAEQLAALRAAAQEQYTKELARIAREREALLLSLQQEGDQKELAQLEASFREQQRLHEREAGVLLALEAKYERDRQTLLDVQATRRAQSAQRISSSQADATSQVFGTGTGQSFFDAQFSARQQQIDADKTYAEERLAILKNANTEAAKEEQAALNAQILRIRNQQIELNQEVGKSKFNIYKLVLGEDDNPENRALLDNAVQQSITAINQVLSVQLAAEQAKVQAHQDNISSLQSQLSAEIQLNKEGSASSIQNTLDQLAQEKAAKNEALAESRRIAKQQQVVNDLQAVSSISLAVANIIAGWSSVPLVGSILGIVAAAAMVSSFVATKQSASDAARSQGFFRGGFTGGSSSNLHEERGPVHAREFVFDNEKTAAYRNALFEPLHRGRPDEIKWDAPELAGLRPNFELTAQIKEEKAQAQRLQIEHSFAPLQDKFDALHDRLAAIEASNGRMADAPQVTRLSDNQYLITLPNGSTNVITVK